MGLFIDGRNLEVRSWRRSVAGIYIETTAHRASWASEIPATKGMDGDGGARKRRWSFVHVAGLGRFSVLGVNGRKVDMMGTNLSSIYGDWTFNPSG